MTVENMSDALVEWATTVAPELQGAYDHATDRKSQPLPDVATEINTTTIVTDDDPRFPWFNIHQIAALKVYDFNVLVMVAPEPAEDAATQLSGIMDKLIDSVLSDPTLGGALAPWMAAASPRVSASYTPPFVQFDDGTKGRLATLSINIAEPKALD